MNTPFRILALTALALGLFACNGERQKSAESPHPEYLTENVVIMIMDGARYTETWGDDKHKNIPEIADHIAPYSVSCDHFYNDGPTYTLAGHKAISTAIYGDINNSGFELPADPSMFQFFNLSRNTKGPLSYVIASKDKIAVLGNTSDALLHDRYLPATDCGVNGGGVGAGYRNDSLTCNRAIEIMKTFHPRLVLINFLEPDAAGHSGDWNNYLQAIRATDHYIYEVWQYLHTDKFYKGKTTVFITNDHGRHTDGVLSGFANHGCPCDGCRHLFMFASGPDFKQNVTLSRHYGLVDIAPTAARLLEFSFPPDRGSVMQELFKDNYFEADAGLDAQ